MSAQLFLALVWIGSLAFLAFGVVPIIQDTAADVFAAKKAIDETENLRLERAKLMQSISDRAIEQQAKLISQQEMIRKLSEENLRLAIERSKHQGIGP